jgi:hypothetical protein
MLRLVASFLAVALCVSSIPALAEDTPPRAEPSAAPPPFYGYRPPQVPRAAPRSPSAVTWGIVLVTTGITGLILGTQLALAASSGCSDLSFGGPPGSFSRCANEAGQIAGMSMLIGGAAFAGGGIGLWIYGASPSPQPNRAFDAAARPDRVVGSGGAAVRWSF